MGFDPVKDFKPVGQIATTQNVIVIHPTQPIQDVKGLINYARANPGKLTYGSSGVGSTLHLSGELFSRMAGIELLHAPYKGSGPARADLLGGHIPMMFSDVGTMIPLIQSGKLRALAVTGTRRDAKLPDVPTVAEAGSDGYAVESWYGLAVPVATPDAVAQRLQAALTTVLQKPEVHQKLAELGSVAARDTSPEHLATVITAEMRQWAPVVRRAGIQLDD